MDIDMQNKPVKKIPERHCVGCSAAKPKSELIRIVRCPDGVVTIDFKGKMSGRGVYICPEISCFKKAVKSKRIESNLSVSVPEELIDKLAQIIQRGGSENEE